MLIRVASDEGSRGRDLDSVMESGRRWFSCMKDAASPPTSKLLSSVSP